MNHENVLIVMVLDFITGISNQEYWLNIQVGLFLAENQKRIDSLFYKYMGTKIETAAW